MAGGSPFIWLPLLLFCSSDSRQVPVNHGVNNLIRHTGNPEVDSFLSQIPITTVDGFNPQIINITSVHLKTTVEDCPGMKEELTSLNRKLQQSTLRNNQLNAEAIRLNGDVRLLKMKLSTCNGTTSVLTSSYRTQLTIKLKKLLKTFDGDSFLILNTLALMREVNALQKANLTTNSHESSIVLQRELQEKTNELDLKKDQIKRSHPNSELILQILSLQSQIWDLEQAESREEEFTLQPNRKVLDLQQQLERRINELRSKGDAASALLELIFVHSKITVIQRTISLHIEKSRTAGADFEKQWRQKVDLLKRKIIQLNQDENNSELTKEILALQVEAEKLRELMTNSRTTVESQLRELKVILEQDKTRFRNLQKHLEETDFTQTQMILKIISIMKEVRELREDKHQATSTSQVTVTETLLQAKEKAYAKAQAEIKELQRKLRLASEECSGIEERYAQVQVELEQKIAELKRTGDSKAALILNVMNLHNELADLKGLISTTDDPDMITDLKRQVEEKQEELSSRTADINRQIANPGLVLSIIKLQNEIWDLQKKPANETTSGRIKELQGRVDDLLIYNDRGDSQGEVNTILMLKVITWQSQVEQLQRQLADQQRLAAVQVTQLRNELATKNGDLQICISELNENNQTNVKLILTVIDLQNQLKNLQTERNNENTSSLTIAQLSEKLKAKTMQHSRDQAEIKELQREIQLKSEECSGLEERYNQVKIEFEQTIAELNRTGDANAALLLKAIHLHTELNALKNLISTTEDPDRIAELQRQLKQKQMELNSASNKIEEHTPNARIISSIFELQNNIWELQKKAATATAADEYIQELQNRMDDLISQIDDKGNEKIKLMLKIMTLEGQVQYLQQSGAQTSQTCQLQLTEQLKEKEKQHAADQAAIKALQSKLNQTEGQCSNFEEQLKNVQNDLDDKIKELQSKTDGVTSLALKVSTLTMEIEGLKRQLQNTESSTKIKELQQIIADKNKELNKLIEELKEISTQPHRILRIITIQTEIEKLVHVAKNDTDYAKITALEDELANLINGMQNEDNENTKLMLTMFAQRDEIERLKKQVQSQEKANSEIIKELENQLEDIRNQIKEKTNELGSKTSKVANLTAEIMDLHKKIKPMEDKISYLTETNDEELAKLKKKLELKKRQLQDSERLLNEADAKNAKLMRDIAELRTQLKNAQEDLSKPTKNINELEERLEKQEKENGRLVNANKGLKQQVNDLNVCCNDFNTQCLDLQRELQEALSNAARLTEQVAEKDVALEQLEQNTDALKKEKTFLEKQLNELKRQLQDMQGPATDLQQQLREKEANLTQLQQELYGQISKNNKLQNDYSELEIEKKKLEDTIKNLQKHVEDTTIYSSQMLLDPDTAHPQIALSADRTEMSTALDVQNVPNYPSRFDVLLAALGSTGYSHGRHYWQISVAGKNCYHVGMAKESVHRKGSVQIRPETGFWSILLNRQGQYRAIDTRSATIPLEIQPSTLGILLDYKKGQISFYNAGARTHIYSFEGQRFTEKIYPFIHLCDGEEVDRMPIVLLPPGPTDWIN